MRHSRKTRKFDRYTGHRESMLKNLAKNIITHQKIKTTLAKAKEARTLIEKLITWGKGNSLGNRRLAYAYLQDRSLVKKLFDEIAPLFKDRKGGYTRVLKAGYRDGDGAKLAVLELVVKKEKIESKKQKTEENTKEDKQITPSKEASKEEKIRPETKALQKKEIISKKREEKKGFISNFRKYFGRTGQK